MLIAGRIHAKTVGSLVASIDQSDSKLGFADIMGHYRTLPAEEDPSLCVQHPELTEALTALIDCLDVLNHQLPPSQRTANMKTAIDELFASKAEAVRHVCENIDSAVCDIIGQMIPHKDRQAPVMRMVWQ